MGSRITHAALRLSQKTPASIAPSPKNAATTLPVFCCLFEKAAPTATEIVLATTAAQDRMPCPGGLRGMEPDFPRPTLVALPYVSAKNPSVSPVFAGYSACLR